MLDSGCRMLEFEHPESSIQPPGPRSLWRRSEHKKPRTQRVRGKKDPAITYFRTVGHYHRPGKLNGRVRNGNACDLPGMVTGIRRSGDETRSVAMLFW